MVRRESNYKRWVEKNIYGQGEIEGGKNRKLVGISVSDSRQRYKGLHLHIDQVQPFINAVPQYDLQVAVGTFSTERIVDEVADGKAIIDSYEYDWMEFNDTF